MGSHIKNSLSQNASPNIMVAMMCIISNTIKKLENMDQNRTTFNKIARVMTKSYQEGTEFIDGLHVAKLRLTSK